jgi:putative colanic acid biosynthesis UDP-glucose lipid carrier transferase
MAQKHSMGHPAGRPGDRAIAIALLVLTLPLMGLVAIAIKCDTRGPIFVRTKRAVGGRPYTAFRFRTTRADDAFERPTRVGRFLQYTQIENLPQLINVLRGEMSCTTARWGCPFFLD